MNGKGNRRGALGSSSPDLAIFFLPTYVGHFVNQPLPAVRYFQDEITARIGYGIDYHVTPFFTRKQPHFPEFQNDFIVFFTLGLSEATGMSP